MNFSKGINVNAISYKIWAIVFSFLYGLYLSGLPIDVFMDRDNYLNYVRDSNFLLISNFDQGFLKVFFNEPLWLILNIVLYYFFGSEESVIRIYILASSSLFSYVLLSRGPKNGLWLLFFLFLPQLLKNYVIHLRQGIAVAIFFLGWNIENKKLKLLFLSVTPLIHASFFFVICLYLINNIYSKFSFSTRNRLFFSFAVCVILVGSLSIITRFVGARQADEYDFSGSGVSGVGFLFWILMLAIFLLEGEKFIKKYFFEIFSLIFYLTAYFFVEISGRVFESVIVLVLVAALSMSSWRKITFFVLIIMFTFFSYINRLNSPWLGFGA